jgi:CheY-like chemotaxis protein
LESSDTFTARQHTPEPVWDMQSANERTTAWNPQSAAVQHFPLRSLSDGSSSADETESPAFILLAEDNPADASLIRRALQEHGVRGELMVISDGEMSMQFVHALDSLSIPCPNLAILDLNLPKRSGKEVLEAMRQSERCNHIPAIVLSSSEMRQDKMDADRLGANRYIRKPLRLEEFLKLGEVFKQEMRETQG